MSNNSKSFVMQDKDFAPVCFNSAAKTVINSDKYGLDSSFEKILYRIDNCIN